MGKRLDRATWQAIELATAATRELAEEAVLHSVTVHRWRAGTHSPGPGGALKLARVLRRRARRLAELADRMEAHARRAQGEDRRPRRTR